jgi:hypothetical protein
MKIKKKLCNNHQIKKNSLFRFYFAFKEEFLKVNQQKKTLFIILILVFCFC